MVIHKDYTTQPHKGTNVANIHARTLLRSLKDRGFVELVFNWQYFYYFINNEGKKYLTEFLGLTEEVVPLTWKYFLFYSGRTRRDNINTWSRIEEEKWEDKEKINPKEIDQRAEGEDLEEKEMNNKLPSKQKSQPKPQPLDLFIIILLLCIQYRFRPRISLSL